MVTNFQNVGGKIGEFRGFLFQILRGVLGVSIFFLLANFQNDFFGNFCPKS